MKGFSVSIVAWGVVGALFGFVSSQYFPIFGGFFERTAAPYSPARMSLIPIHLFVLVPISLGIGWFLQRKKSTEK